jgi:heat-inducible transcriptional repressor
MDNPTQLPALTERQVKILRAMVQEYCETAEAVGSDTLDKKYQIGFSPATIRNEMNRLDEKGYLSQPHTSSGRIPTPAAIKFYVNQLMKEKDVPITEEVKAKQQVWDAKGEVEKLMREVTHVLADETKMLAVAATDQGRAYHAGYANLLEVKEFFDIDVFRQVLMMIDHVEQMMDIFGLGQLEDQLNVLVGDDFRMRELMPVGMVYSRFSLGSTHGSIGVLGPSRLDYSFVIPRVRKIGDWLNEIGREW